MRVLVVCGVAAAFACSAGSGEGTRAPPPAVTSNAPDAGPAARAPIPKHRISVGINGSGSLRSRDGSISCPGACAADFDDGAMVSFSAVPAPGYTAPSFAGDCGGTDCTLTATRDALIIATFPRQQYRVDVQVSGSGVVASTPPGISCPGTCSALFDAGTSLALSGAPAQGFGMFSSSIRCEGGGSGCVASLDRNVTWAVAFKRTYQLTFAAGGDGGGRVTSSPSGLDGTIDCPGSCSARFFEGTTVALSATPDANSMPASWSGDCERAPCSLVITRDSTASLVWRPRRYLVADVGPQAALASDARAMSLDGKWIAGLANTSRSPNQIYLWNGMTGVDTGLNGYVLGVNGSGTACGLDVNAHGFVRTGDGTVIDMGLGHYVVAINDAGTAVGYGQAGGGTHALLWKRGYMSPTDLGAVDGNISSAAAINSSGVVAGASTFGPGGTPALPQHAVRFRAPGLIDDLGTLGGTSSGAAGLSDNGIIVGASHLRGDAETHGFSLAPDGIMVDVGVPQGLKNSRLSGVNSQGTAIGAADDGMHLVNGIVYRGGRLYRLTELIDQGNQMSAWLPTGIAEDGSIAAYGANAQGVGHGVRLVLEPQYQG